MGYYFFEAFFIFTIILVIALFYALIKSDNKKLQIGLGIATPLAIAIVIPLGNQPSIESTMTEEELIEETTQLYEEVVEESQYGQYDVVSEDFEDETTETTNDATTTETELATELETEPKPLFTVETLDQLKEGMSYEQIVDLFGEEGILQSQNIDSDRTFHAYDWENPDGSSIYIQFVNNKMTYYSYYG